MRVFGNSHITAGLCYWATRRILIGELTGQLFGKRQHREVLVSHERRSTPRGRPAKSFVFKGLQIDNLVYA